MNNNKYSLFFLIIVISSVFNKILVEAHFIEDENNIEGEVIDKELDAFKILVNGLEILKPEEAEKLENNKNEDFENPTDNLLSNIVNEIKNKDKTAFNESDVNSDKIEEIQINDGIRNINESEKIDENTQNNNRNTTTNKEQDIVNNNEKISEKEDIVNKNEKISEKEDIANKNEKISEKEVINNKDEKISEMEDNENKNEKISEKQNLDDNNENKSEDLKPLNNIDINVKKLQLIKEHKDSDNIKSNDNNNIFKVVEEKEEDDEDDGNDPEIKSLVKTIIESDGITGEEAEKQEKSILEKIKQAINNQKIRINNSKIDNSGKAKEEDMKKDPNFLKSSQNKNNSNNKTTNNNANNKNKELPSFNDNPGEIFKIDSTPVFKCFFDQECTNFRGFTHDVAKCNITSRHCSNYCYVQKSCLSDEDCSSNCGSWCLKDEDIVFGRCVMTFKEGDFCMESWRICEDGLVCNFETYVCEKEPLPLTFTRIDSQESLLSIVIFLILAIYLIKNSRSPNFVSFFSGYDLTEYCNNVVQDYDPLPEYRRTEVLNPEEMCDLVEPPPETDDPSNVDEAGYVADNGTNPLSYCRENNQTLNCNYVQMCNGELPINSNSEINVSIPSMSDTDIYNEPPPDYEA